jgi:zinc transporter 1/2/3
LIALSIHAVFEGMALGLQENGNQIVYMFMAITFHKWVEALSLGIKHVHINDRSYYFKVILLFSSMTPIGILIGIIFSGFSEVIEAVFLAISAGIILSHLI